MILIAKICGILMMFIGVISMFIIALKLAKKCKQLEDLLKSTDDKLRNMKIKNDGVRINTYNYLSQLKDDLLYRIGKMRRDYQVNNLDKRTLLNLLLVLGNTLFYNKENCTYKKFDLSIQNKMIKNMSTTEVLNIIEENLNDHNIYHCFNNLEEDKIRDLMDCIVYLIQK